jgi:heme/copper-type cytochrome/quinol oxidase subunit 2
MSQTKVINGPWVGAAAVLMLMLVGTGMFYYQFYILPSQIGPPHVPQKITIYIVAQQWAFMVNGTIDTHNTPIVVHVGDNVTFHVHGIWQQDPSFSEHGFFIEGIMDTPATVQKGHDLTISIVPTTAGDYTIICTIFCGAGHANMNGQLTVLP